LEQIAASHADLSKALSQFANGDPSRIPIALQLANLSALRQQVRVASEATLRQIQADVAAAVAAAQSVADGGAGNAIDAGQAALAAAAASRSALQNALSSLDHVSLTFSSPEDEADYRQREKDRQAYIAAQQGKHTPEGDLNAAGAGIGQMVDAKAHGASGPEFERRLNELMATTEKLRDAAKASGISTEEFDRHLREDLRRIMKSKGLSDAQIDARFAATPDPLEAAKAYLRNDDDLAQLRQSTQTIRDEVVNVPAAPPVADVAAIAAYPALGDALAKLSAVGLTLTDHPATKEFAHGTPDQSQGGSIVRKG